MTTLHRLDGKTLSSELSKLPLLTASTPSHLDPVYIAIARAVASGQSDDQLADDLGVPAGWQGITLSKRAPAASDVISPAAGPDAPTPNVKGTGHAPAPDWIAAIMPLALSKTITTRVDVLGQ